MGRRIGVICGAGGFPRLALEEIRKQAGECVAAGIEGQADPGLCRGLFPFAWFKAGEVERLVSFFKMHDVTQAIMAGKIDPIVIYRHEGWEENSRKILEMADSRSPSVVLGLVIQHLAGRGIEIINPAFLLEPYFCREGTLTRNRPSREADQDIAFGLKAARAIADLDIGQTVVVKNKAVVAVEGMEGTDETVRRGGKLAGSGAIVAKVGRTSQDMRIDVPAVGLDTLKALAECGAEALAVEADKVAFFQRDEALNLAEARGIAVVARKV
jgi:hypothetical protein